MHQVWFTIRDRAKKILFYTASNVSSVVQYGGIGALEGPQDCVETFRVELRARRDLFYEGIERTAAFGVTNVDNPLPVDADTLFQVGSITKTFTATAAMRLVDEGRLDLDRPLQTDLPDLRLVDPQVAAAVTPRHLLTHTAGWVGDYFSDTGRGDDALARYVAEMAELEQLTPLGAARWIGHFASIGRRRTIARLIISLYGATRPKARSTTNRSLPSLTVTRTAAASSAGWPRCARTTWSCAPPSW